MQTRSRAQQFGLAGFLYVSPDLFRRPVTRDPLGVALHNHTPIERPAPGLSFDADGQKLARFELHDKEALEDEVLEELVCTLVHNVRQFKSSSSESPSDDSNDKQTGHSATGLPLYIIPSKQTGLLCIIVRDYSNGSPVDQEFDSFIHGCGTCLSISHV